MLSIRNITKRYAKNSQPAVDDLSLEIKRGEIFGFLGPNGAGKTTTIKLITGILPLDSGEITIDGHSIATDAVEAKRRFGYVPDTHDVYERMSGLEYINFVSDIYGVESSLRKQRLERYLAMFELEKAIADPVKSYSHGMKQKLCLIGALIHQPPLWILDEPMTGLDPQSAHKLKNEMREHCNQGNTVFFSTHVLDVAERLVDRIGIINKGKIIAVGTMEQLRAGRDETLESLFLNLTGEGQA